MTYQKPYDPEFVKLHDIKKEKVILLQNILNRAVEIAIHNATVNNSVVTVEEVDDILTKLGTIVKKRTDAINKLTKD